MRRTVSHYIQSQITKSRLLTVLVLTVISVAIGFIAVNASPYEPEAARGIFSSETNNQDRRSYSRAEVKSVETDKTIVRFVDGPMKGLLRDIPLRDLQLVNTREKVGDVVLIIDSVDYPSIVEQWRIPGLALLLVLFIIAIVLIGRRKGVMGSVGLAISIAIICLYVIPLILNGAPSFWVIMSAAFMIAIVSLYVAHGANRRTTIALLATIVILMAVVGLAVFSGWLVGLTGAYDEASSIFAATHPTIDMRGVLVGGMIIATLGVLDDIVTAQVAVVDQLRKANAKLGIKELYTRASAVGGEHIAALINTLALAYVGISLPIVLSIVDLQSSNNLLVLFNSEFIAQELTRTIVSSLGLILAVPISTFFAAILLTRWDDIVKPLVARLNR
ncbi:YibE/F family protein [bacterium]|nr:MAG: YibE/F family protein [bacterium]